jgi:hypothetical protein
MTFGFKTNQPGLAAGRYPAVSAINKSNRGYRQARLDNRRGLLGRFWLASELPPTQKSSESI